MQVRAGGFLAHEPTPGSTVDWLRAFAERPENAGALTHWETLPARGARFGELQPPLPEALTSALTARGIERLYSHQVHAIEASRAGFDTVVVTGTASGKSLCFQIPTLEVLLGDPRARALYLYPTKALAQDQARALHAFGLT
ncbi:MAG: DEAD/DEAH box helicase, partial [bacterium]